MRIIDRITTEQPFISMEFFPPKEKERWPDFFTTVERLASVAPLFVSVTYGAMGSTRDYTLEIVTRLKNGFNLEAMAHLTCVGASRDTLVSFMEKLHIAGVDNVLALRGDPPQGETTFVPENEEFAHATDLVAFTREHYPHFGIAVAAYPEGHCEAPSLDSDLYYLAEKFRQGADFAITQIFFDNSCYGDFMKKVRDRKIQQPVIPGILPVMSLTALDRIVSLCGATIPPPFLTKLEKAYERGGDPALKVAAIDHAVAQARELIQGGAPGIHLYTLNKADACLEIVRQLEL